MNSPRLSFLLPWAAVVLLSSPACISVPDIEPVKAEVRITSPDGTAYTNGVLEVRLEVTGHTPERVELLSDGEVLAEVTAPYVYPWDTAGVAEGAHQLVARAVFGEVTFASEAREVVVDRTAPTVVSRTPEPGAQDVWVKAPIQAVFSEPVKVGSLTSDSVKLTVGGVEVARTVSVGADGRTVTVVPTTAVTAPNTVSLALSEDVTDLAGNKASLTPVNWAWALPSLLSYPALELSNPAPTFMNAPLVRLDKNGNPVVVREEFDGKSINLFVVRWTGTSWEKLGGGLKTRSNPDFSADSPSIQIAPDGQPIVAWHEGMGYESNNFLHVARWTGTSWEQLGDISGILLERTHALSISMQLTSTGLPIIAFNMEPEDIEGAAIHVYQWSGSNWSMLGAPIHGDISSVTQRPAISLDSADNPHVAFSDGYKLYVRRWNGNTWEELSHYAVAYTQYSIGNVFLAFDGNTKPLVFWRHGENSPSSTQTLASQWSGTAWVSVPFPTSGTQIIVRSSNGQLQASWSDSNEAGITLNLYRHSGETGEQVSIPLNVEGEDPFRFDPSSLDSDPLGNTVLTGFRYHPSRPSIVEPIVYRLNQ